MLGVVGLLGLRAWLLWLLVALVALRPACEPCTHTVEPSQRFTNPLCVVLSTQMQHASTGCEDVLTHDPCLFGPLRGWRWVL